MLRENFQVLRRFLQAVDVCIVAVAFYVAFCLRSQLKGDFAPFEYFVGFLPIIVGVWLSLLHYFGLYHSFRTARVPSILYRIAKAASGGFIVFTTITYVFKLPYISRLFVLFIFAIGALLISIERIALLVFFRYSRLKGYNYKNLLIIGTGRRAQHFIDVVNLHAEWGYRVFGLIDAEKERIGQTIRGCKVIGAFEHIVDIVHENVIDEVVFVVPRSWLGRIEWILTFLETEGVKTHLAVDHFDLKFAHAKTTELNGFPIITFETTPDKLWHLVIKRFLDIVLSLAALMFTAPLFLFVALLIKATSPGPVFFRQTRCGLNGRKFTLYKFRTMVVDAEAQLKDLMRYNQMVGPAFKMDRDPRLTPLGRLLRKASLDELPQLWNVLRGSMSIVGPRPPIPTEVAEYESWHRRRLSMRPGITCLWQVSGRNNITDFNKWIKLDLEYIDNWSLWLDFKIMLKTIPTVLFGIGAK